VGLEFENADELEIQPGAGRPPNTVEVRGQSSVLTEEIPLIKDNAQAMEMLRALRALGYSADQVRQGMEELEMIPTTKQAERKAMQEALDARVKNEVGRILGARKINPRGKGLDKRMPTRESFVVVRPYVWAAFFLQGDPRSFQGRDPLDDAAARGRHR
jgi:hypothetical protein